MKRVLIIAAVCEAATGVALNEPKKVDPKDVLVDAAPPAAALCKERSEPLKGGVQRSTGGEQFGLKW